MSTPGRFDHVTFISAGAGSGKTYRLIEELERALVHDGTSPAGIVATTFTVKAATELKERVRDRLLAGDRLELAERSAESLIGTVHSVCERLLKRFAFELGLSPELNVMSIDDGARFFNQALDNVLPIDRVRDMNAYSQRLGIVNRGMPDWWRVVKDIVDKARENNIDGEDLRLMGARNAASLLAFFPAKLATDPTDEMARRLGETIEGMPETGHATTEKYRAVLAEAKPLLERADCPWRVWMRLAGERGIKAIAEHVGYIQEVATLYESHPALHRDLEQFARGVFEIAAACLVRFQSLKRERGLIDFNDMEQFTLHALDHELVRERLADEVELLLVDEFQDTNPMQLALFLKLAALADRAIFVGDVKQAIYEFRGCDPTLVFDTLDSLTAGDAKTDNLDTSWRSRPALVRYINELFAWAFKADISRDLVVLHAQREEMQPPAVTTWMVDGNKTVSALAVAEGVGELVASGEPCAIRIRATNARSRMATSRCWRAPTTMWSRSPERCESVRCR